jgi:hypothetical protein
VLSLPPSMSPSGSPPAAAHRPAAWWALCAVLLALMAPSASAAPPPWGTGQSAPEDLSVALVVFGPGDDIPSWWGHAALGVEDRQAQQARLYNYGNFAFEKFASFAMGRLEFWVGDAPVLPYLRLYQREDRDVRLLHLNLEPEGRERVARLLALNVLPENREYLYHHYRDNCSTRLRDAIDAAVGGQLRSRLSVAPGRMTLREHTRRYTSVIPAMSVLLDFLMNDTIDQQLSQWDEAFLPDELERAVLGFQYTNSRGQQVPLLERTTAFHDAQGRTPVPERPPDYSLWLLGLGLLWGGVSLVLALWLVRSGRTLPRVLLGLHTSLTGLLLGLVGTVLLLMWLLTDHEVTFANENLFLANPLTLLALPLGLSLLRGKNPRTPERLRRLWGVLGGLAVLGLVVKVIPLFDQNNWNILGLLLPILLGSAGAFLRLTQRAAEAHRVAAVS